MTIAINNEQHKFGRYICRCMPHICEFASSQCVLTKKNAPKDFTVKEREIKQIKAAMMMMTA